MSVGVASFIPRARDAILGNRCRYKNRIENRAIYSERQKEPIGKNVSTALYGCISEGKGERKETEKILEDVSNNLHDQI